jgi:tetratricopeptide (TPR) repeat protein
MNRPASLSSPGETERPAGASGYSTRDVAALLGVSVAQVRSYVRAGFLSPEQGARGEHRFSFQDLILLRTAKGLVAARVPHRRIVLALKNLRDQLPEGRPLTGVRISAQGHHVVVRDGREVWNPESGQALLDFEVAELAREAASLERQEDLGRRRRREPEPALACYERGVDLELDDPREAADAYRQALELDPAFADAHLNLGRLLHEAGKTIEAEAHYRRALEARPEDPIALFNLGVALQDLRRLAEAAETYEKALELDPELADAHYNLAVVYEELGRKRSAIRHLKSYKSLTGA